MVAASCYGNTACGELNIGQCVVGVLQRQAVFLRVGIVFQRVGVRTVLASRRKARNGIMLCHLRQNPVVAFLGGSALQGIVVGVRINPVCAVQVGWACAELLLVFPDNRLGRKSVIICVCACNGRGFALTPAVHQSHHNTELSVSRQVLKIRAVLAAFRHIGIARVEINARLYAVNLMRPAIICHQIFPFCSSSVRRPYRNIAVAVINNERIRGFAAVILAVRADIVIAKGRCAAFTFLARPRKGGHRQSCHHHQQAESRRQDTPAFLCKLRFHRLLNRPFLILGIKKSLCF